MDFDFEYEDIDNPFEIDESNIILEQDKKMDSDSDEELLQKEVKPIVEDVDIDISFDNEVEEEQRVQMQDEVLQIPSASIIMTPRPDQIDLFERSKDKNSIIYLETGKGKTLIAMMHIYYQLRLKGQDALKIIFLASTIQLVQQQCHKIRELLYSVAVYMEQNNLVKRVYDFNIQLLKDKQFMNQFVIPIHSNSILEDEFAGWNAERWDVILDTSTIFVMMGQMLLNGLRRGYLKLSQLGIIIFDECHHARLNHPYRLIVSEFYEDELVRKYIPYSDRVQFLGLTASPVTQINLKQTISQRRINGDKIELELAQLAANLHSQYIYPSKSDRNQILTKQFAYYEQIKMDQDFFPIDLKIRTFYMDLKALMQQQSLKDSSYSLQLFFIQITKYLTIHALIIFNDLGLEAYYMYLQDFQKSYKQALFKVATRRNASDALLIDNLTKLLTQILEYLSTVKLTHCEKFLALREILDKSKTESKKTIIFIESKVGAKYLNLLLTQLEYSSDYVVGSGNSSSSSLQLTILREENQKILTQNFESKNIIQAALDTYDRFKIDGFIEEPKNDADEEDENNRQFIKNTLQEIHEGIINYGKGLQDTLYQYNQQQKIIERFRMDEGGFKILISTNVTEEGFDIPNCDTVIIYGELHSLKQYIQQKGRARKKESTLWVVSNRQSEIDVQDIVKTLDKTLDIIELRIENKFENIRARISQLQYQIDKNYTAPIVFYEKQLVKNSFALINTNWSIEILSNYTNYIQPDRKGIRNENYIRGAFYHYHQTPALGFVCTIVLPKQSPLRFFIGNIQAKKEQARRSAAFEATKQLKIGNFLTENLLPNKAISSNVVLDPKVDRNMDDPGYCKIIQEVSYIKKEKETDISQKFFPFKLDVIRLTLTKKLNLYVIQFHYIEENVINQDKQHNYPSKVDIGFIHNMSLQNQSFFKQNEIRVKFIREIELSEQKYEQLQKIHQFLIATQNDWDIFYYAAISGMPIKDNSYLRQGQKKPPFIEIQKEANLIFVLLNEANEIDEELNTQITVFIEKMKKAYLLINDIKEIKEHNKTVKEQNIRLGRNDQFMKYQKIPYCEQNYAITEKDCLGYVAQNISESFHLGKFVVGSRGMPKNEDNSKYWDKPRDKILKSLINYDFREDEELYSAVVLKKYLKVHLARYSNDNAKDKDRDEKYRFYRGEFMRYPLNVSTCFKFRFVLKSMRLVRDYMVATKFQMIRFPFDIKEKVMEYRIMENLIQQESSQVIQFLQTYYPYMILKFEKNKDLLSNPIQGEFRQNHQKSYHLKDIPSNLIFQSLQSQTYNIIESENYQVLEFFGDAVLKLLGTIQVFIKYPFSMEGDLHLARANIVSNDNLRRIAVLNKFYEYILSNPFEYHSSEFVIPQDTEIEQHRYEVTNNTIIQETIPQNYQYLPEKVHADVVEALNGAYMKHFKDINACSNFFYQIGLINYPYLSISLEGSRDAIQDKIIRESFEKLEEILGYRFQYIGLLIQAVTHSGFHQTLELYETWKKRPNLPLQFQGDRMNLNFKEISRNLKDQKELYDMMNNLKVRPDMTYERLEFLGDAVIDAVVVEWLIQNNEVTSPSDLSLKKQCIVCNKALALVSLHHNLDSFLLHETLHKPEHDHNIILQNIKEKYDYYYENIDKMYSQEPMIKVLGDVFESIIGAIFMDSGLDYNLTKQIILNLMEPFMEHFSSPNQMMKNPQDRLAKYFRHRNYDEVEIVISQEPPRNGEYEYQLRSVRDGTVFKRIMAVSEKEAREKILERLAKKGNLD